MSAPRSAIYDAMRTDVNDQHFVELTARAVTEGDAVAIAYAQGTLDNLGVTWPQLAKALKGAR